jgi:hypothetical protein
VEEGRIECVGIELTSIPNPDPSLVLFAENVITRTDGSLVPVENPVPGEPAQWSVFPDPGWSPTPRPVTTSDLRKLNLASVVNHGLEGLSQFHAWWATIQEDRRKELADRAAELKKSEETSPRKKRHDPDFYSKVAAIYGEARRNPTKAVSEATELGGPVARSTAAKWVMKARALGFLGETTRGKPGGVRPTDKKGTRDE